jgi:inhibitor of growth protein 4
MAAYLEDYLDSIEDLPAQIRSNFDLIRQLDEATNDVTKISDQFTQSYVQRKRKRSTKGSKGKGKDDSALRKKIFRAQHNCVQLANQKVALAIQSYDLIDNQVRRLDHDLKRLENELKQEATNGDGPTKGIRTTRKSKEEEVKYNKVRGSFKEIDGAIEQEIDPNEPVYCVCRQFAFGEMISCDAPDCGEWFHFPCVGLTAIPKVKWLCPECTRQKRRQKRQEKQEKICS